MAGGGAARHGLPAPLRTASPTTPSPHFDRRALQRGVGIRFKGREREDVEEYCASEGWVRVAAGKAVDRHGLPVTVKLNGEVETWWREEEGGETEGTGDEAD